jgi:hypothetical protein
MGHRTPRGQATRQHIINLNDEIRQLKAQLRLKDAEIEELRISRQSYKAAVIILKQKIADPETQGGIQKKQTK